MLTLDAYATMVHDSHDPVNKKHVRYNEVPFMSKNLCKAVTTHSRLLNLFIKNKINGNQRYYKKIILLKMIK